MLRTVSPPNPCRHARVEMRDRLIDGSFAVWRVDRCSYNRSLAGRSGSRPRNNSMNRSRNNRAGSLRSCTSFPGPVIVDVTRPDGRRIHGEWLHETRRCDQIRDRVRRMGERLGEFMRSRRDGVGQALPVLQPTRCFDPWQSRPWTPLFAVVAAYGQFWPNHHTFVTALNDGTDGLMGSLDVVDESRSCFFGLSGSMPTCLLRIVSPPNHCRHARVEYCATV